MSKISAGARRKKQKTEKTRRTEFEPNQKDIDNLLEIVGFDGLKHMSQSEWLQYNLNGKNMYDYLYGFMDGHLQLEEIKEDQQKRARAIAKTIYQRFFRRGLDISGEFQQEQTRERNAFERTRSFEMDGAAAAPLQRPPQIPRLQSGPSQVTRERPSRFSNVHLVTMDGHGRMIWCILNEFRKLWPEGSRVPELRIKVMDIDKNTGLFHSLIFPRNVTLGKNIITYAHLMLRYPQLYGTDTTMPLMYFNFTSLGTQASSFFDCLAKFALRNQQCFFSYMLRFTSRIQNPNVALSEFQNVTEKLKQEQYFIDIVQGEDGEKIVHYQTRMVSLRTHFITHELLGNTDVYSLSGFARGLTALLVSLKPNVTQSVTYLGLSDTFSAVANYVREDETIPMRDPNESEATFNTQYRSYETELKRALGVIFSRRIISRDAMRDDWVTYRTTNYLRLLYNLFYYESIQQATTQIKELTMLFRSFLPRDTPTAEAMIQYNRLLLTFLAHIDRTIQNIYEAQRIDDEQKARNASGAATSAAGKRRRSDSMLLF